MLSVIGCNAPDTLKEALQKRGDIVVILPPHPALPKPVASHADLLVFFSKKGIYTFRSYAELAANQLGQISELLRLPVFICREEPEDRYPMDTLLDALPIGKHLICRPASTASTLLQETDFRVVPVAQGYAKCAALPVGSAALITADPSIARACESLEIECLPILTEKIELPGYNTGFIGGAASFSPFDEDPEILFCGDLNLHPNGTEITAFCQRNGKKTVSLADCPLTDVGTVFRFKISL
ncbi:MAG: hypothetical protein E7620_05770 [Ruminococcaceae bacterium]|nr:hypothetical protein [Oscillospiraceae bacterium]